MVWKVKQWYLVVTWVLYWWLLLVFGSGWSGKVKIWPRMGLAYAVYESLSDVGEIRVWFASKNLTPCRMH